MTHRVKQFLFVPLGIGFLFLFGSALRRLPDVGHYRGPYGDILNAVAVRERHATDVVSAVNFDYRGFDTLGEESILFVSVVGATILLRKQPDEQEGPPEENKPGRQVHPMSDAARILTAGLAAPTTPFGLYV